MAYTKTASSSTTTKKTTTPSVNNTVKEDQSAARIAELEAQLDQMKNLMLQMMANQGVSQTAPVINSLNEEVKLIHLVERAPGLSTYIKLSNMVITMHAFGEERTLDRRQAEELAGKCRNLFEDGIIAFGPGSEDLTKRFGLRGYDSYSSLLNSDFVGQLATINVLQLEDLYKRLPKGLQAFVIEYFKRKIIEGDMRFNDPQKIEMLNRVSGCNAMSSVTLDKRRDEDRASMQNK